MVKQKIHIAVEDDTFEGLATKLNNVELEYGADVFATQTHIDSTVDKNKYKALVFARVELDE